MRTILSQMLALYPTQSQSDEKTHWPKSYRKLRYADFPARAFSRTPHFTAVRHFVSFTGLTDFPKTWTFHWWRPMQILNWKIFFGFRERTAFRRTEFQGGRKVKTADSNIKSAFLKGNTKEHILSVYKDEQNATKINPSEVIKIKFEVDTNPLLLHRLKTSTGCCHHPIK